MCGAAFLYQVDKSYAHDLRGRERVEEGTKEEGREGGASFGIKGAPFRELGQMEGRVLDRRTGGKRNTDG